MAKLKILDNMAQDQSQEKERPNRTIECSFVKQHHKIFHWKTHNILDTTKVINVTMNELENSSI